MLFLPMDGLEKLCNICYKTITIKNRPHDPVMKNPTSDSPDKRQDNVVPTNGRP